MASSTTVYGRGRHVWRVAVVCAALCTLAFITAPVHATQTSALATSAPRLPDQYTADLVYVRRTPELDNGEERVVNRQRIFYDTQGVRVRVDNVYPHNEVVVWRFDEKKRYTIVHGECTWQSALEPNVFPFRVNFDGWVQDTSQPSFTVLGVQCHKWVRGEHEFYQRIDDRTPVRFLHSHQPWYATDFANVIAGSPSPALFDVPMQHECLGTITIGRVRAMANVMSVVFWVMVVYQGFRDNTYGYPALPLFSSIAWYLLFTAVYPPVAPQLYFHLAVLVASCTVFYQYAKAAKKDFSQIGSKVLFASAVAVTFLFTFLFLALFTIEFDDRTGQYSFFFHSCLARILFVGLLFRRGTNLGQSVPIALVKWITGTLLSLANFLSLPAVSPLMVYMYLFIFLWDAVYVVLLFVRRRGLKASIGKAIIERVTMG